MRTGEDQAFDALNVDPAAASFGLPTGGHSTGGRSDRRSTGTLTGIDKEPKSEELIQLRDIALAQKGAWPLYTMPGPDTNGDVHMTNSGFPGFCET